MVGFDGTTTSDGVWRRRVSAAGTIGASSRRAMLRSRMSNCDWRSLGWLREAARPGAALKFGATDAVATAVAPCAVIVSGRLVPVIVSGFELKATIAYSAPVAPPLRQIPVPE